MANETKLGRPALPLDEQCSERLAVYVKPEDYELIKALARKKGVAMGVLAREILIKQLNCVGVDVDDWYDDILDARLLH